MGQGAGSIPFRFYRMLVILGTSLFGACGLTSMFFGGYVLYRMDSFLTMLSISASMAMVVGGGFSLVVLIPVGCCTAVRGKLGTLIMFNAVLCISVVVGVVAVAFLNMHMSKLVDVGVMKVGLYQGRGSIGFAEIALNRMENFVNCSFNNCCQPGKPVVARIWGTELPLQHVTIYGNHRVICNEDMTNATAEACSLLAVNAMTTPEKCETFLGKTGYKAELFTFLNDNYGLVANIMIAIVVFEGLFTAASIYLTFFYTPQATARRRRKIHALPN